MTFLNPQIPKKRRKKKNSRIIYDTITKINIFEKKEKVCTIFKLKKESGQTAAEWR